MTYEEALAVLGLRRILPEKQMRVQRDEKVRLARGRGDEEWEKNIHEAWAVLTGKAEAELEELPASNEKGPVGLIKASCGTHKDKTFILDWEMRPRGKGDGVDEVVFLNPQTLGWDTTLDGYVRIDAHGVKKPYAVSVFRTAADDPIAGAASLGAQFRGRVVFGSGVFCPVCKAPHLQWCQHCNTIFCHFDKAHYADATYKCPGCDAPYTWGGTGKPIETVFDGKQLRSLMKEDRKEIAAGKSAERLTHKKS